MNQSNQRPFGSQPVLNPLSYTSQDFFFFFLRKVADIFIALWCVKALGEVDLLPLHHHGLLAAQDSDGAAYRDHVQIQLVLVLADRVLDAAQDGPGILVDGGLHIGGGSFR